MEDWQRVQDLFLDALDLPVSARRVFLERACKGDPDLFAEIDSLLAADSDSEARLQAVVQDEADRFFDAEVLIGEHFGVYRIVREIGQGGMGCVYLAVRDDAEYCKEVALKIVKRGMDTDEVLKRFRYERQILANLDHPYIARLLDGGSTEDGVPFFVMEFVEGRPLDIYCQENSLGIDDRCRLFVLILEAIAYAHRNLVIHRDLKPSNILVAADGTPKLLDFGVAKLLSGRPSDDLTITAAYRPITPGYASPEQVLGLPITTMTDIYSLGAILYEVLSGQPAQKITVNTPVEIEKIVCNTEVSRPSLHRRGISSDLDNIVLKAMRKEPERRYHSVDQFAEDIQRYLNGRPIFARQDSVTYRLRKFLVRNRFELATVTVLIVGLSVGLAVSLLQTRRAGQALRLAESQRLLAVHENARATAEARSSEEARESEARQREIAQRETAVAEQRLADLLELSDRALFDVHDAVAKLPGSMAARGQIVKTTLDYLERLRKEDGLDDDMRLALSSAYFKVSLIQGNYGGASQQDYTGAEASLLKGKNIIFPLYQRKSGDPKAMTRWIQIQEALADLDYQAGRDPEAIRIDLALLPVAHRLAQANPGNRAAERQEPELEARLANSYQRMPGSHSLEHAERGVSLLREQISRYPDDADSKEDLASLLSSAAPALESAGELDLAAETYQQSVQIREDLLRSQPHDTRNRRNLMVGYANYASLLGMRGTVNLGRPTEARIYTAKAVAIARDIATSDPQDATARYDLGMALGRNGMIDPAPEGVKASLANLEEAEGLVAPIAKRNPKSATSAHQLENILEFKGQRLEALGRTADALATYRACLELLEPFIDSESSLAGDYILAQEDMARVLASSGDFTGALDFASRAVAQTEKRISTAPSGDRYAGGLAQAYATLAAVQENAGDAGQARRSAERALEIWKGAHDRGTISIYGGIMADTEKLLATLNATRP